MALEPLRLGRLSLAPMRLETSRFWPLGLFPWLPVWLRARLSARLLETLFYPGTPLHDGGAIVREGRLFAAGCVFPLSEVGMGLGTRHRAALGLSEVSDALVIVVSEETGAIRVAEGGRLSPPLSLEALRARLKEVVRDA